MLCCACFVAAQILLINGLNAGSRSRKDLLDRLAPGMRLFNPLCLLPDDGGGAGGGSSLLPAAAGAAAAASGGQVPAPPQLPLDEESLASLEWTVPPPAGAAASPLQACGGGSSSCCALPAVRIQVPEGALVPIEVAPPPAVVAPQQLLPLADSQATVASVGAAAGLLRNSAQRSPEVAQQPPQWLPVQRRQPQPVGAEAQGRLGGFSGIGWGQQVQMQQQQAMQEESQEEQEDDLPEQPERLAPPAWLAAGIASVGEGSQGSADAVAGQQLLGRRQV
jgi:hypothetical protein